jgi:hypothetical protein
MRIPEDVRIAGIDGGPGCAARARTSHPKILRISSDTLISPATTFFRYPVAVKLLWKSVEIDFSESLRSRIHTLQPRPQKKSPKTLSTGRIWL